MSTLAREDFGDITIPGTPDTPAREAGTEIVYVKDPHWEAVPGSNPVALRYVYWRAVATPYPATPFVAGTPDTVIHNPPDGWQATAHSIDALPSTGHIRFAFNIPAGQPPTLVGIVVDRDNPLAELFYNGYVFADDQVWAAANWKTPGAQPLLNGLDAGYRFAIDIEDGLMRLSVQGYTLHEVGLPYDPSAALWAAAALYGLGAEVRDAKFTTIPPPDGVACTLAPLTMLAGVFGLDDGGVAGRLQPPTLSTVKPIVSLAGDGVRTTLAVLLLRAGDRDGDGMDGKLAAPTLAANGFATPDPASGVRATLARLTLSAGTPGAPPNPEADPPVPVLETLAIGARLRLPLAAGDEPDTAPLPLRAVLSIPLIPLAVATIEQLPLRAHLSVPMTPVESGTAELPVRARASIGFTVVNADIDVYAVNLATSGSTRYRGFPFTSFARIGNRYYGAGALGVCELAGDTDAGAPIDAVVDLGDKDFGTPQRKSLVEAWLALASPRPLVLELRAEGATYTYRTEGADLHLKERRVKPGKGRALQTTFITPILRNEGGADFELDAIQFEVQVLSRKT